MDVLREGDGGLGIGLRPIRNPVVTRPRPFEIELAEYCIILRRNMVRENNQGAARPN